MKLPLYGEVKPENRLMVLLAGGICGFLLIVTLLQTGVMKMSVATTGYVDEQDVIHSEQVVQQVSEELAPLTLDIVIGHIRYWTERRCEEGFQRTALTEGIWQDYLERFEKLKGRPMAGIQECAR